jgi:urease subunit gamma
MHLTPREQEKLLIYTAGQLAADRMKRGLKLNHPEAVAYLTAAVLEGIRDGKTVSELMTYGTTLLSYDDVMPGVPDMIHEIMVEGTFPVPSSSPCTIPFAEFSSRPEDTECQTRNTALQARLQRNRRVRLQERSKPDWRSR